MNSEEAPITVVEMDAALSDSRTTPIEAVVNALEAGAFERATVSDGEPTGPR